MIGTEQDNHSAKLDFTFNASQATVVAGDTIVLNWQVANAERVFINGREVPHEGEQKETLEDDKKFKLEVNRKGIFCDQKQVLAIKVPPPVITSMEFISDVILEKTPVKLRLTLQYCSHWKLEATYLASNRQPEVVATSNNKTWQPGWRVEVEVFLKAACSLVLIIFNGKKQTISKPYYLDTVKPVIIDFTADKLIIVVEGTVRLNWKVAHHHKLLIQPGNHDVSNDHFFDYKPTSIHDVTITLTAYGDFGQQDVKSIQIRIAWLGHHLTSNNGNAVNPEFFLGWDSTYVEHATLNPIGLSIPVTATRFPIPHCEETKDYFLQGITVAGEIVKYPFTLYATDILFFEASRTSAIIGTKLYLRWRVTNARKVTFDHGIGNQTGQEEVAVNMQKGMERITITVWGDINVVTQSVHISLLKGPEITLIKIPLIELKIQLSVHLLFIPLPPGSSLLSPLTQQYKKIYPLIEKMLLPSTITKQLLMRRRKLLHLQQRPAKGSSLTRFVQQQIVTLLSEFSSLLLKTKN